MRIGDIFTGAFRSIRSRALLSSLCMAGVALGVTATILLVSLGEGINGDVTGLVEGLGSNIILVKPGVEDEGGKSASEAVAAVQASQTSVTGSTLTLEDVMSLRQEGGPILNATPLIEVPVLVSISATSPSVSGFLNGTDQAFLEVQDWELEAGTFLEGPSGAVLGSSIAEQLFPGQSAGNIIGQTVFVAGEEFTIIGVMKSKGKNFIQDQDTKVFIPIEKAQELTGVDKGSKVSVIFAKAVNSKSLPDAVQRVDQVLLARHGARDFHVLDQKDLTKTLGSMTGMLDTLTTAIAVVALLEGALSVAIIMYISVQQRRREIGIRAASGATRLTILTEFLADSVTVAVLGGIIGVPLGIGASLLASALDLVPTNVTLLTVGIAFFAAVIVGIVGGLWPAWRAARLQPVEAMRDQ